MFILPFLLNKAILVSLSLIIVGSATVYGGIKVNEHRDTQIILQEAKQLSSSGKYQEAINKLAEADHKWAFGETKKEVEGLKKENKTLIQASVDYELGKELFGKGKYQDALEILKKVDGRNINYLSARNLIELAEKKLDTPSGEVAGVKAEGKKAAQSTPQVLPTPIPTSSPSPQAPILTPQPTSNIDPSKTAELRNILDDVKRQANIAALANVQIQFYQDLLSACLNHVSETINNAPIVAGSKLNYSPSQIQTMRDGCNNSEINNLTIAYNAALKKIQEDKDRANILAAECPKCWEEAQK